jgi:hypothetical protein
MYKQSQSQVWPGWTLSRFWFLGVLEKLLSLSSLEGTHLVSKK